MPTRNRERALAPRLLRSRAAPVEGFIVLCLFSALAGAAEPQGTKISAGVSIKLFKAWPELSQAPKSELGTIEFLIRPDAATINRERALVFVMTNRGGADVAGTGIGIHKGVLHVSAFATYLKTSKLLVADEWVHVALTLNTKTINKQARLWVNGELVADELVLEPWPEKFEVAEMISDHWKLNRFFTGEMGDVRISRTVRYTEPFDPPVTLPRDKDCSLHMPGRRLPLE